MRFFVFLFCCNCLTISAQWFSPPVWRSAEYSAYVNRLPQTFLYPDSALRRAVYDIFESHGLFSDDLMQELNLQYLVVKGQVQACVMKDDSCPAALDSMLNLQLLQQLYQKDRPSPVGFPRWAGEMTPVSRDSILLGISFSKLKWKLLPERFGLRDDIYLMYPENQLKLKEKLTKKAHQKKLFKPGETDLLLCIRARLKADGHLEYTEVLNRGKNFSVLLPVLQQYLRIDSFFLNDSVSGIMPVASLKTEPQKDVLFYWDVFSDYRWFLSSQPSKLRRRTKLYLNWQTVTNSSGQVYTNTATSLSDAVQFRAGKTFHQTIRINDTMSLLFYWTHVREDGKANYLYKAFLSTNGTFTDTKYYSQFDPYQQPLSFLSAQGTQCMVYFTIFRKPD